MIFSHQNQVDEAFLSSVLECVKSSQDKGQLKNALFSLIRAISAKKNASKKIQNADFATKTQSRVDLERIFGLLGEIFCAFREKIYGILEGGDILDCSFLYLSFITPHFFVEIFRRDFVDFGANSADFDDIASWDFFRHFYDDERFLGFVNLADKMLVSHTTNTLDTLNASQTISQEEWLMLVELGSISRVLAFPSEQYRAKSHKNAIKTSKIQKGAIHTAPSQKNRQKTQETQEKASQNNASKRNAKNLCEIKNAFVFFSAFVSLSDMQCAPAQKIQPFIYEAYRLFELDFSLLEEAIFLAFENANNALKRRNVCNWQLHIFWNVAQWFNIKEWLNLYPLWKKIFYERIAKSRDIMDFVESNKNDLPHDARHSIEQGDTLAYLQEPNLQPLYQAIDEVLYLQLFMYHFCGNSFISQEQWRGFNTEVLEKSTSLYREFGAKFLAKSSKIDFTKSTFKASPKSTKSTTNPPPKSSKKVIGFLRDRFVENSPFKVEYSLIKNLMDFAQFRERYSIKIYCMSLIEKSENDPRIMQLFARLGVEIIDIGLAYNRANFYNSHLQKAFALRELMLSDKVAVLISPNNGYGISDFLLSVRCAPTQVFWTHGNFVYDIVGIDWRLTHICNDLAKITHEGVEFGGIPVKMDNGFYNPPVLEEEIAQARENIAHLLAQNMAKESNAKPSKEPTTQTTKESLTQSAMQSSTQSITQFGTHFGTRHILQFDTKSSPNISAELEADFAHKILQDKVILGVMGRLTKIDSMEYLEVICEILHRRKECVFLACGVGNEEHIKDKILRINPSVLHRFCFTGQIDSAVYGHIIDVWLDSFPMEQGESRIEYVAKGRGIALRYFYGSEGEFLSRLEWELDMLSGVVDEILCDENFSNLSLGWGNLSLGNHCRDLAVCDEARTSSALTSCQTAKNSTSTTANNRIVWENGGKDSNMAESSLRASDSERGNPPCNKNKIDCHEFATFDKIANSRNDKKNPPSLAEGVRGRVESTLESSTKTNAESSLRDLPTANRGNPLYNKNKIDCHEFATFDKIANSRNDNTICHTEEAQAPEVSQAQLKNKDILAFSKPQYDKKNIDKTITCHAKQAKITTKKMDFASYKNIVLGFSQNRAFCKEEYLQKALKLIDSTKKKDKNFKNALHTQSLIFEMGNAIKERLGVRYFMEFLDSHS